jgi:hypothetical protein
MVLPHRNLEESRTNRPSNDVGLQRLRCERQPAAGGQVLLHLFARFPFGTEEMSPTTTHCGLSTVG